MNKRLFDLMSDLRNQLEIEMRSLSEANEYLEIQSHNLASLGKKLNEKRKVLQLDLQTLELQTGISSSTLKRLFKDPSQVKFISVVKVAEILGVKLCSVK